MKNLIFLSILLGINVPLGSCQNSEPAHLPYIIELPVVAHPETVFNYSDGASHLISVIITQATGQNTLDFAKENLFVPLEITT